MGNSNAKQKKNENDKQIQMKIDDDNNNNQHLRNLFVKYTNNPVPANRERYVFIQTLVCKYPLINSKELEKEFNFFEIGTNQYNLNNITKYHDQPRNHMFSEAILEMDLMRECYYDFIVRLMRDFNVDYDFAIVLLHNYTFNINSELTKKTKNLKSVWKLVRETIEKQLTEGLPKTITNYEHYINKSKQK